LRLNSRQPDALRELGELYSFTGDYPKAEDAFHKALELDPKNATLHQDLGNALMKAGATDHSHTNQADAELRQAVKLDPSLGAAHRDLGLVLRDQGKFEEAVRELRSAASLMPSDSSVHYQLSRTLRRAGKSEEASREAARSEQLGRKGKEAQQVLARANEGLSLVQQGHTREGLVKIREALQIDPENLTAHFNYAVALRHVGRYDESIEQLQKVLRVEADMPAVASFRRAAGLIPGTAAVHNGLGVALAKSGDAAAARTQLLLAQKLEPKTALFKKNLECIKETLPRCVLVP
jgi:Flp pilus assembly protein TadD